VTHSRASYDRHRTLSLQCADDCTGDHCGCSTTAPPGPTRCPSSSADQDLSIDGNSPKTSTSWVIIVIVVLAVVGFAAVVTAAYFRRKHVDRRLTRWSTVPEPPNPNDLTRTTTRETSFSAVPDEDVTTVNNSASPTFETDLSSPASNARKSSVV
jgi:hypothetical protein